MDRRLPFRHLEPYACAGLFDDPLLLVHVRPAGASCLFECGQLHHLAKRVLKRVYALFITHAHMDHFMGFDAFIRHNHASSKTVDIYGPPGITDKVAHKLASYDWNLAEPYWCSFRVHEVEDDRVTTSLFAGPSGFLRLQEGVRPRSDRVVYRDAWLDVKAESCDHRLPSLVYRLTERPPFAIDPVLMASEGLVAGEWLPHLKRHLLGGVVPAPLTVLRRRVGEVVEEEVTDPTALYGSIRRNDPPAALGYVGDIGADSGSLEKVVTLMEGVTLLVCGCSFPRRDREKARRSGHLCTEDLNLLVERAHPRFLLPVHFSKSCKEESALLYDELELPAGTALLRLPEYLTPRPLLTMETVRLDRAMARSG